MITSFQIFLVFFFGPIFPFSIYFRNKIFSSSSNEEKLVKGISAQRQQTNQSRNEVQRRDWESENGDLGFIFRGG